MPMSWSVKWCKVKSSEWVCEVKKGKSGASVGTCTGIFIWVDVCLLKG